MHPRTRTRVHRKAVHHSRMPIIPLGGHLKIPRRIKLKSPLIFPRDGRTPLPTIRKRHVIVDLPPRDHRARKIFFVRRFIPLTFFHIVLRRQQGQRRERGKKSIRKDHRHTLPRLPRKARPRRKSSKTKVAEIRAVVVRVRNANALPTSIFRRNTITDQSPILLKFTRKQHRIDGIAPPNIAVFPVVPHRQRRPIFFKRGITFPNVFARIHHLIIQRDTFHPSRRHHPRRHPNRLPRLRLNWRMTDRRNTRQRGHHRRRIALPRRRLPHTIFPHNKSRTPPRTTRQMIHRRMN